MVPCSDDYSRLWVSLVTTNSCFSEHWFAFASDTDFCLMDDITIALPTLGKFKADMRWRSSPTQNLFEVELRLFYVQAFNKNVCIGYGSKEFWHMKVRTVQSQYATACLYELHVHGLCPCLLFTNRLSIIPTYQVEYLAGLTLSAQLDGF